MQAIPLTPRACAENISGFERAYTVTFFAAGAALVLGLLFPGWPAKWRGRRSLGKPPAGSSDEKRGEIMATDVDTPAMQALDRSGISYRYFRHAGPVGSVAQAAEERGLKVSQVIRSILFRTDKDEFVMVLVAGGKQISWPGLRRHLGQSRLTLATQAEVLRTTGYPVGAVSPLGLAHPVRLLVDCTVFSQEVISLGCGERNATIILKTEDLKRALGEVEEVDIASDEA